MNDNKMNKMPVSAASGTENDYFDEAFLYENTLKNLQHEIEEKQKILHKLQNKVNPSMADRAKPSYYANTNEYEYKNKDIVQKIKDEAADVLISELKNISSHLKRKLNDIDEKERRISSRLIELEERQAILEEIDYVQRMIPKKMIDEKMHSSAAAKQETNIEIEDMFRPAVNMIAEKSNKLQKLKKETSSTAKTKKPEKVKDMIYVPSHSEEQKIFHLKPDEEIADDAQIDYTEIQNEKELNDSKQKEVLNPSIQKSSDHQNNIDKGESTEVLPIDAIKSAIAEREAKKIKSITPKPQRKGMNIQERDWKNFAYIKDSKVKLKQDDLLNIHKTIIDIEQGRISTKGI